MKNRKWYTVSAKDKVLGRLATRLATILMGKNKADYAPHEDNGDFVVVTDAAGVKVSGSKAAKKEYFFASTRPGKSKTKSFREMKKDNPEYIIEHAVKGMLPKNKLGSRMIKRLKVYAESEHPHGAQNPEEANI